MKLAVYNQKGETIAELDCPKELAGLVFNSDLVHQVYTSFLSNERKPVAHTKDRSEVSGGGRKPWVQKGTGRARQGSIRSPLWKGGGVVFGPRSREENFSKKINKKMKQASLKMVLSKKLQDEEVKILDSFSASEIKTKQLNQILKNILKKDLNKTKLVILNEKEQNLKRALRNIPNLEVIALKDLNIKHLLNNKFVILSRDSFSQLEKKLV